MAATSPRRTGATIAALAALVVCPAPATAATAAQPLAISPAPGTPDANPKTQISILGIAPSRIASVRLAGAASGVHAGKLRPYSGKRGASFLPAQPLTQGERADVVIHFHGRKALRYSFTVARLGVTQPPLTLTSTQPDKLESFVTAPGLLAPKITVNRGAGDGGGSVFLAPLPSPVVHPGVANSITIHPVGPGGPMITDDRGQLVWFRQLTPPTVAANLRLQRYRGKTVMTWWQGTVTPAAFGLGTAILADSSYRTVATVRAGNGYPMDLHELELTPEGDALFTIYSPVMVHLPGTPAGTLSPLLDAIVQQVDIATGLVVWEFHALGNIPISESYVTPKDSPAVFDLYHFNAMQEIPGGVLISARNTSAIYRVQRAGSRIVWTLGGEKSDFKLGPGARFFWQHDPRALSGDRITMFDDGAGPPKNHPYSRGIVLKLDQKKRTAKLVSEYARDNTTSAQSEGSVQVKPDGNVFVGYGSEGFMSEFSPAGKLVFDAAMPVDDGSYRAFRHPWVATPPTKPVAAARLAPTGGVAVYASWNGATEVARWQVLAGADAGSLAVAAAVPRSGFETRVDLPGAPAALYAVRALDAKGRTLSTSPPVPAS